MPTYTTGFAGPSSVFVPSFNGKATASLIVSYARNPKKFAVTKLTQNSPVDYLSGYWLTLRPEVLARIMTDPNETVWVDGQPFPKGTYNQQDYKATQYNCIRRGRPAYVGWQTREQAAWDIQDTQLQVLAHQMMTQRAYAFYTLMNNSANYLSTHVNTATGWSGLNGFTGGLWSAGTSANPIIRRTLLNVANQILQDTMAAVTYTDLTLVVTPPAAIGMSSSAEINDMLARSPYALAQVRGDAPGQNGEWGMPDKIYGMDLVVDPTLQTTSGRLVLPGTTSYLETTNQAIILAAPGGMSQNVGQTTSAFSSVHFFFYRGEEMVTETLDDDKNRLTELRVWETWDVKQVSPESCGLVTNLFF